MASVHRETYVVSVAQPKIRNQPYTCVDDILECNESCLPKCSGGTGLCAEYCQNSCLSLLNEQCGFNLNLRLISGSQWKSLQELCGNGEDNSGCESQVSIVAKQLNDGARRDVANDFPLFC